MSDTEEEVEQVGSSEEEEDEEVVNSGEDEEDEKKEIPIPNTSRSLSDYLIKNLVQGLMEGIIEGDVCVNVRTKVPRGEGWISVKHNDRAAQQRAKMEKMRKYNRITRMALSGNASGVGGDILDDELEPEAFQEIMKARQAALRTKQRIAEEKARARRRKAKMLRKREREARDLQKWEEDRLARMEELRKFKEEQVTKRRREMHEARMRSKEKHEEMTRKAAQHVRTLKLERTMPLHMQLESDYKSKISNEQARYKEQLAEQRKEKRKPLGALLESHERRYLEKQAHERHKIQQSTKAMMQQRNQELKFYSNPKALKRAKKHDILAQTAYFRKQRDRKQRAERARSSGNNFERTFAPTIDVNRRRQVQAIIEEKRRQEDELDRRHQIRLDKGFKEKSEQYMQQGIAATKASPKKKRRTPKKKTPKVKRDTAPSPILSKLEEGKLEQDSGQAGASMFLTQAETTQEIKQEAEQEKEKEKEKEQEQEQEQVQVQVQKEPETEASKEAVSKPKEPEAVNDAPDTKPTDTKEAAS